MSYKLTFPNWCLLKHGLLVTNEGYGQHLLKVYFSDYKKDYDWIESHASKLIIPYRNRIELNSGLYEDFFPLSEISFIDAINYDRSLHLKRKDE